MTTQATHRARVRRGANYLDAHLPKTGKVTRKNWRKLVTNDLHMDDGDRCILGHVFGDYMDGLRALAKLNGKPWIVLIMGIWSGYEEAGPAAVTHGFEIDNDAPFEDWARLEMTWRRELGLPFA